MYDKAFADRDSDAEVKDLPSENVANQAFYYATRRFTQNSRLHQYLADKCPNVIFETKKEYNLFANEQLFDPQNPTVVLCDLLLEDALDVKALHVTKIMDQVCKQFHPKFSHSYETQTVTQTQTNYWNNEENRLNRSDTTLADDNISTPSVHEPIISPSWVPFNVEGRYFVKPAFLRVLRAVERVRQTQVVFPYKEVANILYKYIINKIS